MVVHKHTSYSGVKLETLITSSILLHFEYISTTAVFNTKFISAPNIISCACLVWLGLVINLCCTHVNLTCSTHDFVLFLPYMMIAFLMNVTNMMIALAMITHKLYSRFGLFRQCFGFGLCCVWDCFMDAQG